MKRIILTAMMLCMMICLSACEETEEAVDKNNDIIVRNMSAGRLWIQIDGSQRGSIDNDGIAKTMWDDIADGVHVLEAYSDENYTVFHCAVTTDLLVDGDDFAWYLEEDNEYSGTKNGDC
ncbi:hypothetical protein K8T06_08480 [bacterium]|nr:hypothetical protein [bacterium]